MVAVLSVVCGVLAWEYHAVATPGEDRRLEQLRAEVLDEAGVETEGLDTVVVELGFTGVGVEVGVGIGTYVGLGAKLG